MKENLTYELSELLPLIAKGDQKAFTRLFFQESDKLSGYIMQVTGSKETAEEIIQDVFTRIWQQREKLTDIESFDNYLFIITRNAAVNQLRRLAAQRKLTSGYKEVLNNTGQSTTNNSINYQRVEALHQRAIEQLTPRQKEVYILSREEGMKRDAIANELGISEETVKEHLKQAMRSLRAFLRPHLGELWMVAVAILTRL